MTTAHNLTPGREWLILERSGVTGGLATQFKSGEYWFDYGGHYFHFQDKPKVKTLVERFGSFKEYKRKSKTFLLNRYIPFPVQFHLSYLPAAEKKEILVQMLTAAEQMEKNPVEARTMADFLYNHFGIKLTELFFKPFLSKYYNTPVQELTANMDRGSIPVPDAQRVVEGYRGKTFGQTGYNPVILYPVPSLRAFIQTYSTPIGGGIQLNRKVVEIDIKKRVVKTTGGDYRYDELVSTMPLNRLLDVIRPSGIFPSSNALKHTSTLLVNVVLKRKRKRFHWVYLAEKKFPFYRAGLYAGHPHPVCYLERNIASGGSSEIDRAAIARDIAFTLKELNVIKDASEMVYFDARVIPVSYVIFDRNWHSVVPPLLEQLRAHHIHSIGRYGTWNYSSMSNDIKDAIQYTETVLNDL